MGQVKTPMAHPKKKEKLQIILDAIKASNGNFTLLEFDKTTHQKLEELRAKLREADSKMRIIKNSLFEKAVNKLATEQKEYGDLKPPTQKLKNQSILLTLGEDWATGIKTFHEFAKTEETMKFKLGYVDQRVYEENGLEALAKLPSKDQLIAKLIGTMKNPMQKTAYSLKYNVQKLAYVLNERGKQAE
jgi:large subunit ribosomal protein L10